MVLLISSSNDASTDAVMDWIDYLGGAAKRVNTDKLSPMDIQALRVSNNKGEQLYQDGNSHNRFTSVWFRRPATNIFKEEVPMHAIEDRATSHLVNKFLEFEAERITDYIYYIYNNCAKTKLGNPFLSSVNKLEILSKACYHGLQIPETIITANKPELIKFKNRYKDIITKAIYETPTLNPNGKLYKIYTEVVTDEIIEQCPETFFPSLFQEKLEKEVELRVFYLNGQFHAAAIFSQNDEQTAIDFRRYNTKKPNRKVPFNLPAHVENNLHALMVDIGLNSGSIDLILAEKGEYVFLEINPVGQYGMISQYSNAILSKEIAKFLLNHENEMQHT